MKKAQETNYLDQVPSIRLHSWTETEDGSVVLHVVHQGWVAAMITWLFRKSKVANIPMDEVTSKTWKLIDGERTIKEIGDELERMMGDAVDPVYERLSLLMRYLSGQGWIKLQA